MPLKEMRALPQWVVCNAAVDKAPRDIFGKLASPTNPETWDSFENCEASSFPNVGFVLSENDPYTIVDLDEPISKEQATRHKKIVKLLNSYTEKSVSGKGLHIIVKGTIPKGVRRDNVEIYSTARYMVTTFKPINKKGIENRQEILDVLFKEMNTTEQVELEQHAATMSDEAVLKMASGAANSDKFLSLCQGDFTNYPSQSEADFALMSMFAFYSIDNEQVKRLFRMSKLGKRKKAERETYLDTALRKIRAKQPAPVDTAQIREAIEAPVTVIEETEEPDSGYTYPPGLVGDIARYIKESSTRPVMEVSLVASLALCAGMWGRAYNISGTGLNSYIILLAKTGIGKDGAWKGINRLVNAMRGTLPGVTKYMGPARFASGQGLVRTLDEKPCFISVLGEFGSTVKQLSDAHLNPAQEMLKGILLAVFSLSGHGDILQSHAYADREKNTKMIASPSVTLLGECTTEAFYEGMDLAAISSGFMPRLSVVHYKGLRPPRNESAFGTPPAALIKKLVAITERGMKLEQAYQVQDVQLSADAKKLLDNFDKFADALMNETVGETVQTLLWNRAHLKALKLAALLTLGDNHNEPVVDAEKAQWAIDFVTREINGVLHQFETGEHGTGNQKQEYDLHAAMRAYAQMTPEKRKKQYEIPRRLCAEKNIVPFCYLRKRLRLLNSFKNDRRPVTDAIKAQLKELCESESLLQLPPEQAWEKYGTRQPLYIKKKIDPTIKE